MKKVTQFHESGKPNPSELLLAIDVSSRSLDIYGRYMQQAEEYEFSDSISNDLRSIAGMLDHYDRHAGVLGYTGLAIVLEPSGRHEQKLTRLAHDRGHSICMVNPERMYKAGVIHHDDDGKSDAQDGKVLFMMARMGKVSRFEPLEESWQQAESSCLHDPGFRMHELLCEQLDHLWESWGHHAHRSEMLGRQMIHLVEKLAEEHRIPPIISGFTELMRAKILAEIGPLERFVHWRQLLAYSGLKIRMRQSGKYQGKDRITKKGRVLLRKLLGQAAFSLTRSDRILGEYYS